MAKYLSAEGAKHLVNKIKQNFVSSNEPVQAAYSTNAGYSDTAGSATRANQATNDAAGNPIHSTYLTVNEAAGTYLQKNENAVSATNAITAANCTGTAENSTRLTTPRTLTVTDATGLNEGSATTFDGTSDVKIKLPATFKATLDGNAATATRATSDGIGNVISNHYAPNFNPVFSGTPTAPTPNSNVDNDQIATTKFVQTAIRNLIGSAPETLDTLYELADAINQDKNFAATMANELAGKQDLNVALTSLSNLVTGVDTMIYTNAANSYVTTILTAFMRTLLDDTDAESARKTLNALGIDENAISASKLKTARELSITDGVNTGTATNFDGTSNIAIALPSTIKAELDGNAKTATNADSADEAVKLKTARTIQTDLESTAAADFDGTKNIFTGITGILPAKHGGTGNSCGNAASATKLENAREISITDGVNTGTATNFDGTSNISIALPATIKAELDGNAKTSTRAEQDAVGNIFTTTYAPLVSPELVGTPTAPTADSSADNSQIATTKFVQTAIKNLIGASPETLDTLFELARAVNDDPNFATTMATALAGKQDFSDALTSIAGLNPIANKTIYSVAPNVYALTPLTTFARTLIDDADAQEARNTLNALGKDENAVSATNADFATQAEKDFDGNVITEKYMPKISELPLTISLEGWVEDDDADAAFNFYYDVEVDGVTADDVVNVVILPNFHGLTVTCGLSPTVEIFNGKIRLRAKAIPTAEISAEYYVLKGTSSGKAKSYGAVNTSTSQRVIVYKIPAQIGELTFNGNVQMPVWEEYDQTQLAISGEISGINAGTRTVYFTPIGNCTFDDDSRLPRSQTWKINRAAIVEVPAQVGTLTYNGEVQSPVLNNFDAEQLTLYGDFENKVDAGTYTAFAIPTSNYAFIDGIVAAKSFSWTIEKAEQIITLDKNSLYLENIHMSDTIIVNRLGEEIISVKSSDENIVAVSNVDSEISITAIATGNATITIEVAEGVNYTAASVTVPVECFVIKPLDECTPAEIVDAIQSGKSANAWDVGDLTAPIPLNGLIGDALTLENFQIRAQLIGFNHNAELESSGKFSAHFLLGVNVDGVQITLIDTNYGNASASGAKYFQHNVSIVSNEGGWENSNLRVNICADIFNALPAEWQNIIAPCTKYTDNTDGGVDDSNFVTATTDKIFLLAEYEVFGKKSYANSAEQNFQAQYTYFKNGNSKIRYSQENNETACQWWLRSAQVSNSTSFSRVSPSGTVGSFNVRYSQGVTPAFMVC